MDKAAEIAIRAAFGEGQPHNARTIPDRARKILNDMAGGSERIAQAIEDMVRHGVMEAHAEPWKDWKLLS